MATPALQEKPRSTPLASAPTAIPKPTPKPAEQRRFADRHAALGNALVSQRLQLSKVMHAGREGAPGDLSRIRVNSGEQGAPPAIQAKAIGVSHGDKWEREADQFSQAIVSGASTAASLAPCPTCSSGGDACSTCGAATALQRKAAPSSPPVTGGASHTATAAGGQPLPPTERTFFEERLGLDLRSVRIHTGQHAIDDAAALHAVAFTHGEDIKFGKGQYQPGTTDGRRLLAHELAHVAQQRAGRGQSSSFAASAVRVQREEVSTEEIEKRLTELERQLTTTSMSPEDIARSEKERNRLADELRERNAPMSKLRTLKPSSPDKKAEIEPAVPQTVSVGVSYRVVGALGGGSSAVPPSVLTSLGTMLDPGSKGGPVVIDAPGTAVAPEAGGEGGLLAPTVSGGAATGGQALLRFLDPMPGAVSPIAPNVYTRFAGPVSGRGFFDPNQINLNAELRPRFSQGVIGKVALDERITAFELFKKSGLEPKDLARLAKALEEKGAAGLAPEEAALLRQVAKVHATIKGATPASPLMSLTELTPNEVFAAGKASPLPEVATQRAYVVRVQIDPDDVGRVNELLNRSGDAGKMASELEVVVAEDLAGGAKSTTRILSITRNPSAAAPLGGVAGSALTWGGRALVFVGAALAIREVVTAKGPHKYETEGHAAGSFAGATVLGALGAGFCVGAGIATGGAALLLCGLAFGALGGFGGGWLGGKIGGAFDNP